jgi:hypothetical protein
MELIDSFTAKAKVHRDRCIEASLMYVPEKPIQCLVIGESPPISGSYFYIPENSPKPQSLPAKVFRAYLKVTGRITERRYSEFLSELQDRGFYLIDLCTLPINQFCPQFRSEFIIDEFESFRPRYLNLILSETAVKILLLPSRKALENGKDNFLSVLLPFLGIDAQSICKWNDLERTIAAKITMG